MHTEHVTSEETKPFSRTNTRRFLFSWAIKNMAASSISFSPNSTVTTLPNHKNKPLVNHLPNLLKFPGTTTSIPRAAITFSRAASVILRAAAKDSSATNESTKIFHGPCYVVRDNIDTDQIIPAEYLTLVPSKHDEYEKLGSYALVGLPSTYTTRFIDQNEMKTKYKIIIAGDNFGCGSSREHAPVALGAAGCRTVVAESYARIFFRNSVATGEIYPLESEGRLCEECRTGDVVTIEMAESRLINHTTGKEYKLKPIGDAGPVIEAGGIFAYARNTGMIPTQN